jgi:hypothetical protein
MTERQGEAADVIFGPQSLDSRVVKSPADDIVHDLISIWYRWRKNERLVMTALIIM